MPGRERLRRGVGHAQAVPREPSDVDLGRLGQRAVPRCRAGDGQVPRQHRSPVRRNRRSPRLRPEAGQLHRPAQRVDGELTRDARGPRSPGR